LYNSSCFYYILIHEQQHIISNLLMLNLLMEFEFVIIYG